MGIVLLVDYFGRRRILVVKTGNLDGRCVGVLRSYLLREILCLCDKGGYLGQQLTQRSEGHSGELNRLAQCSLHCCVSRFYIQAVGSLGETDLSEAADAQQRLKNEVLWRVRGRESVCVCERGERGREKELSHHIHLHINV